MSEDTVGAIRACGYRVIIDPESEEKMSSGGIVIVPKERFEQEAGQVVAVGPMAWTDQGDGTPWAKVGDRVIYSKYGGKMVEDPDTKKSYRIINDEDVIAVINSEEEVFSENYFGDTSKWRVENG